MPVGNYSYQFFICCPRDCVSRHNGGTSGAPLKPLRVDSDLSALGILLFSTKPGTVPVGITYIIIIYFRWELFIMHAMLYKFVDIIRADDVHNC